MSLKTDYKDYELAPNMGGKKRYRMINNDDGTVSFVDVSEYLEIGDTFKADDINATNNAINEGSLPSNAVVFKEESTPSTPAPRDADTLGGHNVDYFASNSALDNKFENVKSVKPYGDYQPVGDGRIATKISIAIEGGVLYLQSFDANGQQIALHYVALERVL